MTMIHKGILMVTFVTVLFMFAAQALPVKVFNEEIDFQNSQMDSDDTKNIYIQKLLMLLSEQQHSGTGSYADTIRDPDVKKALLSKKINTMCHFKLCNLGRR